MKVIKRLCLYLISVILAGSLFWIMFHAAGSIPQAGTILAGRSLYGVILPGAFLAVLLMAGLAAFSKDWRERYIRTGIAVSVCLIVLLQFFYLYFIRIYISYDHLSAFHEAVSMLNAQQPSVDFVSRNAAVIVLYGLLKAAKVFGVCDLYWIPCLFSMLCMDVALFFGGNIVWKVKGSRMCFLFLVFCLFNPIIYIWIPWYSSAICSLPFFMGGICFAVSAGKSGSGGKRAVRILLMLCMISIGVLFMKSDDSGTGAAESQSDLLVRIQQAQSSDWEEIADLAVDRMAVMWQDGSDGFSEEWMCAQTYSRGYVYICGEKNDIFLAYIQNYYIAVLFFAIWGTVSAMIKNAGGSWMFLRVLMLGAVAWFLLWEIRNGYAVMITILFGLLAVDGLSWMERQREYVSEHTAVPGKWIGYGICCVMMLGLTGVPILRATLRQDIHWREFSVCNTFAEGEALEGLTDDDTVLQTFTASHAFDTIDVQGYFEERDQALGGCRMELLDEEGRVLESCTMTAEEIRENHLHMKCDVISPEEETRYTIRIIPVDVTEEHALCIQRFDRAVDIYPQGTLKQNHEYQNGDLVFCVYKDNTGSYWG